jgi:hypothetical protein
VRHRRRRARPARLARGLPHTRPRPRRPDRRGRPRGDDQSGRPRQQARQHLERRQDEGHVGAGIEPASLPNVAERLSSRSIWYF